MTERTRRCHKCGGKGKLLAYSHIANGRCSACLGTGRLEYRAKPQQPTMAEHIADLNERLAALYPNRTP